MKPQIHPRLSNFALILSVAMLAGSVEAAAPTAVQALKLSPIQEGVDYDKPGAEKAAQCTISSQKLNGRAGWIVRDPDGTVLRMFVDNNDDHIVDQWSYFKDGVEVYRDIDADFNRKADQCRWFNTAGSRWGVDENEDGRIDRWKVISAEEVSAEVVAALASGDADRFARLALSDSEVESLGIGKAKAVKLSEKIAELLNRFKSLAGKQKTVTSATRWLQFSGGVPGIVPIGTDGSTKDLQVYENVVAVVQTGKSHVQVQIGTLLKVGDTWRVIDVPRPLDENVSGGEGDMAASGFFFRSSPGRQAEMTPTGPNEETQKLLGMLEEIDKAINEADDGEKKATLNARRADLLQRVAQGAGSREERAMWLRQMADMISAAVQSGTYPDGAGRLESMFKKLDKNKNDKDLAAYFKFRQLTAQYVRSWQTEKADFSKIQARWFENLERFVEDYPTSPDAAEAMLQLAMSREFAAEEDKAIEWYDRIAEDFPNAPAAKKAAGARIRLRSEGKPITLRGKSTAGEAIDLAEYRGKAVLVQYWATWSEPSKTNMAALKELLAKYGSRFRIIGVSLDRRREALDRYLAENRLPWPQIFEEGGMESRLANQLGIHTVPTMILIDQQGKVVRRSIGITELDRELKKLVGPAGAGTNAGKAAKKKLR